jgi:predicted NBD/HSP70 family sugar kinase
VSRINSALIRQINTARVFHALREHPGSSQRALGALTGLDASTVSSVVAGLEAERIVQRVGGRRSGLAGRPEGLLQINPDGGVLIGASIETDCIRLLACGLDGARQAGLQVAPGATVEAALDNLKHGVETLLTEMGLTYCDVRGVGVGQHGLIDRTGHLVLAPRMGWRDVAMGEKLRALFPVRVQVENDTKAAALAERLFGACQGVDDFVIVHGGSGIGGALYLQGTLYRGVGLAGELGHMKIVAHGQLCGCGGRGCLEAYISEPAIRARLADRGRWFDDTAAVARAAAGDAVVREVLDEAGGMLGLALANLANLLNPSRIVLAGSLAVLSARLLPAARAALADNALMVIGEQVEIIVSDLGEDAVELGAVGLAMDGFLPLPARLGVVRRV